MRAIRFFKFEIQFSMSEIWSYILCSIVICSLGLQLPVDIIDDAGIGNYSDTWSANNANLLLTWVAPTEIAVVDL